MFSVFGCNKTEERVSRSDTVFSEMTLTVNLVGKNSKIAHEKMLEALEIINNDINPNLQESSITLFNNAQKNFKTEISYYTYQILDISLKAYQTTDGLFDTSIFGLSKLWHIDIEGYARYGTIDWYDTHDKNIDFLLPTKTEIEETLNNVGLKNSSGQYRYSLEKDTVNNKFYLIKNDDVLILDLGGIAKGYATDVCIDIAKEQGLDSAIINISGNLAVYNKSFSDKTGSFSDTWKIGIGNPRKIESPLVENVMGVSFDINKVSSEKSISLVTSGDYQRVINYEYAGNDDSIYSKFKGNNYGYLPIAHIINPKTGLPMSIELLGEEDSISNDGAIYGYKDNINCSVTIIATSSILADAYSTAASLMSLEDAYNFLLSREEVYGAIIFTNDKRMAMFGDFYVLDSLQEYQNYSLQEF